MNIEMSTLWIKGLVPLVAIQNISVRVQVDS